MKWAAPLPKFEDVQEEEEVPQSKYDPGVKSTIDMVTQFLKQNQAHASSSDDELINPSGQDGISLSSASEDETLAFTQEFKMPTTATHFKSS